MINDFEKTMIIAQPKDIYSNCEFTYSNSELHMASLTEKESEALLVLLKDYTYFHNANTVSKLLAMSRVGILKIFNKFHDLNVLKSISIGKSRVFKINLDSDYARTLMNYLLADEANNYKRWKVEFKGLFKEERIVLIFGSMLKGYRNAKDIDVMIVMDKNDSREVNRALKDLEQILPKKIHAIKLTKGDLLSSLKKKDKAMVDAVKNAVVLYGYDIYLGVLKSVSSYETSKVVPEQG